jgi:glucan-binding YG repeat protein
MKHLVKSSGIAVLFFVLGTIAPAYAQEEHHEEQAKPEQQKQQKQHVQEKQEAQQSKSAQQAQQKQEVQQSKSAQQAQQKQEVQQSKSAQQAQQKQEAQQSRSAQHAQSAQQTQQASNNDGGRIPDDRFRAHFGRDHGFRINRPVMVSGYPRFQYGGYWFGFVDPWPVGWYYTDQVYVDYINGGYYLLSPVHPGFQISINVIL